MVPVPPTTGVPQVNVCPVVCDSETNVVLTGTASVSETLAAADGPLFVSVNVYVMSVPAVAVAGPLLTTPRSAEPDTVAGAVWLLLFRFGSAFGPVAVAVLFSVPVNAGSMFAVSVNWLEAVVASCCNEQVTVPGLFGAGVLQNAVGPVFWTSKLNVVPAGSVSENDGLGSRSGPLFVSVIVQEIVPPAVAVAAPVFAMARSLLATVVSVDDSLLLGFGSGVGVGSAIEFTSAMFWNSV